MLSGSNAGELLDEVKRLRSDLTACQLELDRITRGVVEIAQNRPMSAMTRRALRELIGSSEPQT